MIKKGNRSELLWDLYESPGLFRLRVQNVETNHIQINIENDCEEAIPVATCPEECIGLGEKYHDIYRLTLEVSVEELPRLIAILNEIYRATCEQTIPYCGVNEPELPKDRDDRIATLHAYKFVADRLHDDMDKLGMLTPLE